MAVATLLVPADPIAMVVPIGSVAAGAGSMTAVVRIVVTVPTGSVLRVRIVVAAGADSMAAAVRIVVAVPTGSVADSTAVAAVVASTSSSLSCIM